MQNTQPAPEPTISQTSIESFVDSEYNMNPNSVRFYRDFQAVVEKPMLDRLMNHFNGNKTRAAEFLGINRATLTKKLANYGLN